MARRADQVYVLAHAAKPLGRLVSPEEVAGLTAFLLGPEGGAITGRHLVQCAGASLGGT